MNPIIFEAFVFLKINRQYYSENTKEEKLRMRITSSVEGRVHEDDGLEEILDSKF